MVAFIQARGQSVFGWNFNRGANMVIKMCNVSKSYYDCNLFSDKRGN